MLIKCEWEGIYHVTGVVEAETEEEAVEKLKQGDYEYGDDFEPDGITHIYRVGDNVINDGVAGEL